MSETTEMYDDEMLSAAIPPNFTLASINERGDVEMRHEYLDVNLTTTAEKMGRRHFHDSDRGIIERTFAVRPDLCYRMLNGMRYCVALEKHIREEWGREVRDKDVYEMAGILRECGKLEGFISDMKRDEYGWSEEDGFSSNEKRLYAVHGEKN